MANKQQIKSEPTTEAATTYKSFTVVRKGPGWSMVTTTLSVDKDGNAKVTDVIATQPDLKTLAIEAFKLAAVKYWNAQ